MRNTTVTSPIALAALLGVVACGKGGPSKAEFVEACKQTQATPAICECAAKEAKEKLSTKQFTLMVLDMQGKRQEVEALAADMSFEDRARFAELQFGILGKCMPAE